MSKAKSHRNERQHVIPCKYSGGRHQATTIISKM